MAVYQLKEMDFFQLKLLADKEGVLYVRDGKMFIYTGADKIKIEHSNDSDFDLNDLPDSIRKLNPTNQVDFGKDKKESGVFHFSQMDDGYILYFITQGNGKYKGTVHVLKCGNATDSL